jgi:hypothetical protein
MRERIRSIGLPSLVYLSLEEIATLLNPVLRGWIQDYGRFYRTELIRKLYRYLDDRIAAWLGRSINDCGAIGSGAGDYLPGSGLVIVICSRTGVEPVKW